MSDNSTLTSEGYALSTFHQRVITSILLIIAGAGVLIAGGWLMVLAVMVIALLMDREWHKLTPSSNYGWLLIGIAYITLPAISALALRDLSLSAILFPIALVIATDVGAFFAGKTIGGPKLAPAISPNKTWAGLIGGVFAAALAATLLHSHVPWPDTILSATLLGIMAGLAGQAGDLFESWLKRLKGVKDSGTLLPGHGGILDRLDGYIFVLPGYLLYLIICAELAT